MTEEEWLEGSDPKAMLNCLRGKASDRQFRLYAVACCRRLWDMLIDRRSRDAVDIAERYADGFATQEELYLAELGAEQATRNRENSASVLLASVSAKMTAAKRVPAQRLFTKVWGQHAGKTNIEDRLEEDSLKVVRLLFDIFGNPFRPIVADPVWLTPTVQSLAAAIYQDLAFDRLPILADALEEAGCTNADVLLHCRQPGEHVRGCWVVDLMLGKK